MTNAAATRPRAVPKGGEVVKVGMLSCLVVVFLFWTKNTIQIRLNKQKQPRDTNESHLLVSLAGCLHQRLRVHGLGGLRTSNQLIRCSVLSPFSGV